MSDPYLAISDFKYGMDRRRKRVAGVAGTLWTLKNAVINRGGDIERAKRFVPAYTLPAGTFGMWKIRSQLYVFGSSDLAASMPQGVLYQRLVAPGTPAPGMTRVLDVKSFAGKLYAIAEYDDGNVYHFYDGTRITDWDTIADGNSSLTTLAEYLAAKINASSAVIASAAAGSITVQALVAGTPFTISGAVVNAGTDNTQAIAVTQTRANVVAVGETRAAGTVTITGGTFSQGVNVLNGVTVNGVALMQVPVSWLNTNDATAAAVAVEINNRTNSSGYTASAAGAVVTVTAAPGTGATPNGYVVAATVGGNVTATTSGTMSGGVTPVAAVAQIEVIVLSGAYESVDQWAVTVNGTVYVATGRASGTGLTAATSKRREWAVAGTLLVGSELNVPNNFSYATTPSTAYVALDASNESEGSERLIGMSEYSSYFAVFSRISIRLYTLSTDATQISFYQTLNNTGALAARAVTAQGNNDVFYLAPTGIRSLRPRDVLNAAYVSDVGTALDTFIRDHIVTISGDTLSRAVGTIEPIDGRYMLALDNRVYVLSYFPSSNITAWSYFEPGFSVSDFAVIGDLVYARAADTIYIYGGPTGQDYPNANEATVTVELPFLTADSAATEKLITGFDMAGTNSWAVELLVDPNDETKTVSAGVISKITYPLNDDAEVGRTTHFAAVLTCTAAGPATISSLAFHFEAEEKE